MPHADAQQSKPRVTKTRSREKLAVFGEIRAGTCGENYRPPLYEKPIVIGEYALRVLLGELGGNHPKAASVGSFVFSAQATLPAYLYGENRGPSVSRASVDSFPSSQIGSITLDWASSSTTNFGIKLDHHSVDFRIGLIHRLHDKHPSPFRRQDKEA